MLLKLTEKGSIGTEEEENAFDVRGLLGLLGSIACVLFLVLHMRMRVVVAGDTTAYHSRIRMEFGTVDLLLEVGLGCEC